MAVIEQKSQENIFLECDIDDIYYSFGEYIYDCLKPKITTDLDMFKYILGKFYLDSIFN